MGWVAARLVEKVLNEVCERVAGRESAEPVPLVVGVRAAALGPATATRVAGPSAVRGHRTCSAARASWPRLNDCMYSTLSGILGVFRPEWPSEYPWFRI